MKVFIALCKKEMLEYIRKSRLTIMLIIFLLFGIMNPAMAKLTPWLMETMSDSLAESGFVVKEITVDALTSWNQFFKNVSMIILFYIIMVSSTFTQEYQKNTLIPVVTKGVPRYLIVISKLITMSLLWTVFYCGSAIITYGYNAYFWNNNVADNLFISVLCCWLIGISGISAVCFFSAISSSNTGVLLGITGAIVLSYIIGFIPHVKEFVPTRLLSGASLITSEIEVADLLPSIVTSVILSVVLLLCSIILFNKKKI